MSATLPKKPRQMTMKARPNQRREEEKQELAELAEGEE